MGRMFDTRRAGARRNRFQHMAIMTDFISSRILPLTRERLPWVSSPRKRRRHPHLLPYALLGGADLTGRMRLFPWPGWSDGADLADIADPLVFVAPIGF